MRLKIRDVFDIIGLLLVGLCLVLSILGGFAFTIAAISGHIAFK